MQDSPGKTVAARGLVNGGTASEAQRWDERSEVFRANLCSAGQHVFPCFSGIAGTGAKNGLVSPRLAFSEGDRGEIAPRIVPKKPSGALYGAIWGLISSRSPFKTIDLCEKCLVFIPERSIWGNLYELPPSSGCGIRPEKPWPPVAS